VFCFPGPTGSLDANGILIASAFFARLTRWLTDHITRSVTIGGAQPNSVIVYVTTSIYWSSRLDRWDQLQQSAAIFSCKTRRGSVYLETLQYRLEESISHRRTRQVTQLFTYLLTHKLFSSCIRQNLVPHACDWVIPALSVVLITFSFQFSLLSSMSVARQLQRRTWFNQYWTLTFPKIN